ADQQQVILGGDQPGRDDLVVVAQVDRDDAARPDVLERGQLGLLHQAAAGGEHQVRRYLVVAQREHLGDPLVRLEGEQVGHVLAAGVAAGVGQLVGLGPVDPALVGEEKDPVVGHGGGDMGHTDERVSYGAAVYHAAAPR